MTTRDATGSVSPVREGLFRDGPDAMLLNPEVSAKRWRRTRIRLATRTPGFLCGIVGLLVIMLGIFVARANEVLLIVAGLAGLGFGVLATWLRWRTCLTDHRDHLHCSFDRTRGEFFYRCRDFRDHGPLARAWMHEILAIVDELHRSPARPWIDPELPAQAHRLAWDALWCLYGSRNARTVATELASHENTDIAEWAEKAAAAVAKVDALADETLFHLRSCRALLREWATKPRRGELESRAETALAVLPGGAERRRIRRAGEDLAYGTFAHITAARDVTQTGPFPWENPEQRAS